MKRDDATLMRLIMAMIAGAIMAACASIGRPNGGAYDEEPPVYVGSNPANGATNVKTNRITIDFDENVQVEDVINKVVVSPAQKAMPSVTANGRRVTVNIKDSLIPNTTYTIDFSDAIRDLNESNILDGFALDFSTGDSIDHLRISGMVFEAATLEPAQGMVVGVYSNLSDTAITTLPLERIAKTNQLGQFTIRGLKPGQYRIFAINDVNRDYHWDRTEDVAFYDMLISPSTQGVELSDTLADAEGNDSIVKREGVEYLPNDILLTWFNEGFQSQYLKDNARPERRLLKFNFAAPSDTLPRIVLTNGPMAGHPIDDWAVLNTGPTRDTLEYYITAPEVLKQDTLFLDLEYLRTDTLQQLTWGDDSLRIIYKEPKKPKKKDKKKKGDKKHDEKADTTTTTSAITDSVAADSVNNRLEIPTLEIATTDSVPVDEAAALIDSVQRITGDSLPKPVAAPRREVQIDENGDTIEVQYVDFKAKTGTTQEVYLPLLFEGAVPIDTIIADKLHFEIEQDSVWDTIPTPELTKVFELNRKNFTLSHEWKAGTKYRFTADSAAIHDIYGLVNKPFKHEFTVRAADEYSALYFALTGVRDSAMVEVLNKDDKPVATAPVVNGTAAFPYLMPGSYYARLYFDRNGNGKWDTGSLLDSIQPEEVYYYPNKINLKKNWDVEQSWDINATPIDLQKHKDIKKNKPKEKKKRRRNPDGSYIDDPNDRNRDNEDEEDEYDDPNFFGPGSRNSNTASGRRGGFRENTNRF